MGLPSVTEPPLHDQAKSKPPLGPNAGLYRAATCISTWHHIFAEGMSGVLGFEYFCCGGWFMGGGPPPQQVDFSLTMIFFIAQPQLD